MFMMKSLVSDDLAREVERKRNDVENERFTVMSLSIDFPRIFYFFLYKIVSKKFSFLKSRVCILCVGNYHRSTQDGTSKECTSYDTTTAF